MGIGNAICAGSGGSHGGKAGAGAAYSLEM